MYILFIFLSIGYLLGSFPSAVLIAKAVGKDIFATGSGNMGAMNSIRNIGVLPGLAVLALDIGKGALAAYLGLFFTERAFDDPSLIAALAALVGAVLGHAYSVFAKFRGGKALAVSFGALLVLFPTVAWYAVLLLVALILITRKVELASIATVILLPVIMWFYLARINAHEEVMFAATTAIVLAVPIVLSRYWLSARHARTKTEAETA